MLHLIKQILVNLFFSLLFFTPAYADKTPVIAAASSAQLVLEEIKKIFIAETGLKINISYGSSGNLSRQIMQGAPFELFISADESYVSRLKKMQLTQGSEITYAIGRMALFVPNNTLVEVDEELLGLKKALKNKQIKHFAIANPEHAPYGRVAKEILINTGLWDPMQDQLVLAENIAQAAHYASTKISQGGLISYSFALLPFMKNLGKFVLIPQSLHSPLYAQMILIKQASPTAIAFYQYIQSRQAKNIFNQYGFLNEEKPDKGK